MSSISERFAQLKAKRQAAYIPYVCAGDPDRDFSLHLMTELVRAGADILELGLPFSDPIADGAVIQRAMNRSLAAGFRVRHIFEMIERFKNSELSCPVVLMSYLNPIVRFGQERFCERLAESGCDGLLVVDMPIEESESLHQVARDFGLDLIQLIAPSSDDGRVDSILSRASGFVYLVSVAGTTGVRDTLAESAIAMLKKISSRTDLPLALGFGISTPGQVREAVIAGASGIVEGSKLISICEESGFSRKESLEIVARHVKEMKAATNL